MLAKVLVLAIVAVASCEDHGYRFNGVHHEPSQQYKHHYERVPIRGHSEHESAHEPQYTPAPQSHGHTYSSQSIIHHTGHSGHSAHSGHQGSQEAHNEHVAPVYQFVQEEEEAAPVHHDIPANHYQSIQYAAPANVQYENSVHAPQPHANIHQVDVQPHYAQGHEEQSYGHGAVKHEAPVYHGHHDQGQVHDSHDEPIDYYAYPKYRYEYKVDDPHTGDSKFQHEYRDGDVVKGVYGVQEPDGSVRIVEYSSDKDTGFTATVKHTAPGQHVQIESHHEN